MPDPDPNAREPMDAPGTRVTPQPDEHPGHDTPPPRKASAPSPPGRTADDSTRPSADEFPPKGPADISATEGGTGTSGSRGGGPAADFRDADTHGPP